MWLSPIPSLLLVSTFVQQSSGEQHPQLPLRLDVSLNSTAAEGDLRWDRGPDPDGTEHLIFSTVSSLLQLWPNTIYRSGHTIVPVTIPIGTSLYHGRETTERPAYMDWLAFDFEHAEVFAAFEAPDPGYVFQFITTRDLKLLYFDGSSAAKVLGGGFDSQDVVTDREVHPDVTWEYEWERFQRLCNWGKPLGLDGFLRMELHFEVMYCAFSDGLQVVDIVDIIPEDHCGIFDVREPQSQPSAPISVRRHPGSPNSTEGHHDLRHRSRKHLNGVLTQADHGSVPEVPCAKPPPGWIGRLPTDSRNTARIAGKWHDFAPGETRVRLDYANAVTFYDPAVRSLVEARRGQSRMQHRLLNISVADADMKVKELEDVITRNRMLHSGIDWESMMRIVVERYGQRLELLNDTLGAGNGMNVTAKAAAARAQILGMMLPYTTRANVASRSDDPEDRLSSEWLAPVARRCAAMPTDHLPDHAFTPQERLLRSSISGTLREICRRLTRAFSIAFDIEEIPESQIDGALTRIRMDVGELMDWLDWTASWVKCRPACGWNEQCVVPTWPFEMEDLDDSAAPRCIKMPDF